MNVLGIFLVLFIIFGFVMVGIILYFILRSFDKENKSISHTGSSYTAHKDLIYLAPAVRILSGDDKQNSSKKVIK